jgi:hypothetical protein
MDPPPEEPRGLPLLPFNPTSARSNNLAIRAGAEQRYKEAEANRESRYRQFITGGGWRDAMDHRVNHIERLLGQYTDLYCVPPADTAVILRMVYTTMKTTAKAMTEFRLHSCDRQAAYAVFLDSRQTVDLLLSEVESQFRVFEDNAAFVLWNPQQEEMRSPLLIEQLRLDYPDLFDPTPSSEIS